MSKGGDIKSLVVVDLETNGFPWEQFNKCSITEITLYAFSAKCLTDKEPDTKKILNGVHEEGVEGFDQQPPQLPRVLHKLSLLVNPRRTIDPSAERITGLSNELLEYESPFDKNTADCINSFLERLEKPICMVAHNGWSFDFPVLRYVYEKIDEDLPSSIFYVDSLKAFREIDEKREQIDSAKEVLSILEADVKEEVKYIPTLTIESEDIFNIISGDPLEQNSQTNWQHLNETTPQRKKKAEKRTSSELTSDDSSTSGSDRMEPAKKRSMDLNVRRSLFTDNFVPKSKYPLKGLYKLGNIFKRIFKQEPLHLHRAETDVEILTKLILYYGLDFLAYAEERKEAFSKVPRLGSSR